MSITVNIKDAELQALLKLVAGKMAGDLTPAMISIGETIIESVQTNFESGGRPSWPPLAASTIKQRQRQGKWPGMILVRKGVSGGLMGAIHYQPARSSVIISANKAYAAMQQFGARKGAFGEKQVLVHGHDRKTKKGVVRVCDHRRRQKTPWGNVPARPFLMIQPEDWETIKESLANYLLRF